MADTPAFLLLRLRTLEDFDIVIRWGESKPASYIDFTVPYHAKLAVLRPGQLIDLRVGNAPTPHQVLVLGVEPAPAATALACTVRSPKQSTHRYPLPTPAVVLDADDLATPWGTGFWRSGLAFHPRFQDRVLAYLHNAD